MESCSTFIPNNSGLYDPLWYYMAIYLYIMAVFGVQLAGVIPETRSVCDLELCVGDVHPAYH